MLLLLLCSGDIFCTFWLFAVVCGGVIIIIYMERSRGGYDASILYFIRKRRVQSRVGVEAVRKNSGRTKKKIYPPLCTRNDDIKCSTTVTIYIQGL